MGGTLGGTEVKAGQVHFTPAIGQIPRGSRNLVRGSHCKLLQKAPLKLQLSVNSRAVEITNLPYNKPYITYTPEPQGSFQMWLEVSPSQVIWNRTSKLCFMVFNDQHQKCFTKVPKREETPQATAVGTVIFPFFPFHEIARYFMQCFVRLSCSF